MSSIEREDDRRVIVIGSGPAGAAAALELIERGIPVLMLESAPKRRRRLHLRIAGGDFFLPTAANGEHRYVATGDPRARWVASLSFGGLSNYWSLQCVRFDREDFTEGERLHEQYRWPVAYDELLPYYARMERLLGLSASGRDVPCLPASVVAEARAFPRDWEAVAAKAPSFGRSLVPRSVVRGRRWTIESSGTAFNSYTHLIKTFARSPLFRLVAGAHVLRIESEGRRATGVVYHDREARVERRLRCRAIVLGSGPLASTRILLGSQSREFPEGLGNTEGVLGNYLHDHPMLRGLIRLRRPLSRIPIGAYLTRRRYVDSPPLRAAAGHLQSTTVARGLLRRRLDLARTSALTFWLFGTMIPSRENFVRLHPAERDEFGLPILDLHIRFDEAARDALVDTRDTLVAMLDGAGCGPELESTLEEPPGTAVHYAGTVRMHASPRYGMLDGFNTMHAVPNVLVVDAACWTTACEKNPTLTVMAMAARAANRLAADLRASR